MSQPPTYHDYSFNTTSRILCQPNVTKELNKVFTSQFTPRKVMATDEKRVVFIVTDKGLVKAGLINDAVGSIAQSADMKPVVFSDVVADPPDSLIETAVDILKASATSTSAIELQPIVVGFGGGSSMDVAKVVAYMADPRNKDDSLDQLYGVGQCSSMRLPLVQIPTTAGTGSEVTPISILTLSEREKEKKGIVSPVLLPDLAVLDAALTTSVPSFITAATGIDALVHAVEAYTSRIKKNIQSDMFAREAMRLLGANIRSACTEGACDLDVRSKMLLGSCFAGSAFANAPVGAVHALAYPIGAQFKVAHGLSNSLVLPHVLRFNADVEHVALMYDELNSLIFNGEKQEGTTCALADNFADLAKTLAIETRLREVGISETDLESLAQGAMQQTRLLPNNPRDVAFDDALKIYAQAY